MHAYYYRESRYWYRRERPRRPHVIIWTSPQSYQRMSRAFPTKTKAIQFKRYIDRQLNQPLFGPDDPLWDDLIDDYNDILAAASHSHRYTSFRALGSFAAHSRPERLSEITPAMIDRYLADFAAGRLRKRKPTEHERRKDWKALHAFFETWVRRGLMPANPVKRTRQPDPGEKLTLVPTDEQWIKLLEVLPRPDLWLEDPQAWHLLILLAVTTGIDRDQLLRITLLPRSSTADLITFKLGEASTGGVGLMYARRRKTRKVEIKGLPPVVSDRLAIRLDELPAGSTFLFPWRMWQRKQWDRIRRAAHFSLPFKTLRAAAGTRAAEAAALEAGRHQLGHASVWTTKKHYLELQRIALAAAKQLRLPMLPPFPEYGSPEIRARRLAGKPGRRPKGSG